MSNTSHSNKQEITCIRKGVICFVGELWEEDLSLRSLQKV